ncbi:MAG: sulfatase, partial [Kiritimatiellae bacterium]|nr:sulfatase [Kiritimatiellia bacterium]
MRKILVAVLLFGSSLLAEAKPPNILFVIADDWSFGHAGAYGCSWIKTPAFDRVARDGILFTRAYTPSAKCAPSRSCILTGRNPWQLEEAANHWCFFPAKFKSFVEALSANGYFTGRTAKGWAPGIAKDADGNHRNMAGRPFNARKCKPPTRGISNNDYAANFTDFLDAAPEGQPWCFWLGAFEPHRGYEFMSGARVANKKLTDIDKVPAYWPDNETVRHDMLDYALEVEYFDSHLARVVAELEQRGKLADTLVVVTSDNGMPFPRVKGQTYGNSNHLPLAMMWQNGIKRAGVVVDDYVSFIDLAPTFLEVAELSPAKSGMQRITGRSLTDILYSGKAGQVNPARDHLLVGRERNDFGRPHDQGYPVRGIVKDNKLYLNNFKPERYPSCNPETGYLDVDGSPTKTEVLKARKSADAGRYWEITFGKRGAEELYDLSEDSECMNNLVASEKHQQLFNSLKTQLLAKLKEQHDPRVIGN